MKNGAPAFPYIERVLSTFVELEPYKLTSEIEYNILEKLRDSHEGRCNEYGFITHVTSVESVQACEIRPEDLMAHSVFRVSFSCIICRPCCTPQMKDVVVLRVRQASNSLLVLEGGPMMAIVQTDHIDTNIFDVHGDAIVHRLTSQRVEPGSLVRMEVIGIKFHVYDTNIKMIGKLTDVAHKEDEEAFYYDPNNDTSHVVLRNKIRRAHVGASGKHVAHKKEDDVDVDDPHNKVPRTVIRGAGIER